MALISESLANRLWPQEPPAAVVGRTLRQGDVTGPLITVAGVVEDVRPGAVDRESPPVIYRPHDQWASGPMTLVVRTAQEPVALGPAVRAEIRKDRSEPPDSRHTHDARDRLRIGRTTALPDGADFLVCCAFSARWASTVWSAIR